jgi:stress response protein YsnF
VSETVTQTVPVRHEELRVVREPIAPGELPPAAELTEERHEVLLYADRPVVNKEVVAVERVRLDTVTVQGQETVTGAVRKEHVEVDEQTGRGAP